MLDFPLIHTQEQGHAKTAAETDNISDAAVGQCL